MAIFTYENPCSLDRVKDRYAMVGSSYFIALATPGDRYHASTTVFHKSLQTGADTTFYVNVVVSQECVRMRRKGRIRNCLAKKLAADRSIEPVYRGAVPKHQQDKAISELIHSGFDSPYKHRVRQGDLAALLALATGDMWAEQIEAEELLDLEYYKGSSEEFWSYFGSMMNSTALDPTDCMIANSAVFNGMDALFTCDCDYTQVADRVDVYMPESVARSCVAGYDPALDRTP